MTFAMTITTAFRTWVLYLVATALCLASFIEADKTRNGTSTATGTKGQNNDQDQQSSPGFDHFHSVIKWVLISGGILLGLLGLTMGIFICLKRVKKSPKEGKDTLSDWEKEQLELQARIDHGMHIEERQAQQNTV
ncbi:hypothetical protein HDU76_010266 [Blyttiomyces sp. JEL0837]|nr:hypothetical protein HDU76_010266 [Blyttiomyces sp. JEL0837]